MTDPTTPPPVPYVQGPDTTTRFGHPSSWPTNVPPAPPVPVQPPARAKSSRLPLVAALVAGALVLMLGTGLGVWWFMRPASSPTGPGASSGGTMLVAGVVRLRLGQFTWESKANPVCQGWRGFDDIRGGAQVAVTDSGGKVLAVGKLETGTAEGITDEADGTNRAESCALPFRVTVPRGRGPYGVEISHRGVMHYEEGNTATIALGFS